MRAIFDEDRGDVVYSGLGRRAISTSRPAAEAKDGDLNQARQLVAMSSHTTAHKLRRKISDPSLNRFVAEGVEDHRPTKLAPESLLRPIDGTISEEARRRYPAVLERLKQAIGPPFFANDGFILFLGDCRELLSETSTSGVRFEMTVTSPPYNIGKEYESPLTLHEYVEWCGEWMGLIHEVSTESGAFWLNVGYVEVPGQGLCVPIPYLIWNKSPFYLLQEIVWKYGAGVSTTKRLSPRNEKWLFYVKNPNNYIFNLDDIRDPNVKYPNQKKNGKFRCNPLGKNPSDVWEFPKVTTGRNRSSRERTNHPAQFPLQIIERIVRVSSRPGDIVLDPFAGSCSAGLAAVALGRVFVGFELSEDYCEMAVDRYYKFKDERWQYERQRSLF